MVGLALVTGANSQPRTDLKAPRANDATAACMEMTSAKKQMKHWSLATMTQQAQLRKWSGPGSR